MGVIPDRSPDGLSRRLRQLFRRMTGFGSKSELEDELVFHLDRAVEANRAAGMSPTEARRQALIGFGGLEQAREETWRQRPGWLIETALLDLRYALRGFRRSLGFTITVIATLALGIGATTAVFSVVDRILFRALPYGDADRLVSIGLVQSLEKQEFTLGGFFFDWRDNQKPFEAFASQGAMPHTCALAETNPAELNCIEAQSEFLPLLGVTPVLGRNFSPQEDVSNGPHVVLITYGLWQNHFGLDSKILDRTINIDGVPEHVIGVLPKDFQLPTLQEADVIRPLALVRTEQNRVNGGIGQPMRTFARLRRGISIAQAAAEMQPLFTQTQQAFIPADIRKDFHLSIRSLRDRQTQDVQLTAWILLCSVLAVLLIACANVASLMMARGAARERELAVRSALGASRGRLVRQTLTEAFLLSLVGAVLGLALAEGLLRIFVKLAPTSIPFLDRVHLDLRIASFTILLSLLCGALFGLIPALHKPRALAFAARTSNFGSRALLRRTLVAGQIAISMVLLTGAALVLRSFQMMEQQNLGMQTKGVMILRLAFSGTQSGQVGGLVSRKGADSDKLDFFLRAEAAVRHVPGVSAVGWSDSFPPGYGWQGGGRFSALAVEGRPRPTPGSGGIVRWRTVTPDYFRALSIPIVRGRNFREDERGSIEKLVILSQMAAARLFPNEDPIGKRIDAGSDGTKYTVVGVAQNVRNGGLTDPDIPEFYSLRHNMPADWGNHNAMVFDTTLSAQTVLPWVRSQIAQLDPTVPVEIEPLTASVSKLADRPRFETALLGFFAFIGLIMAIIGLYGLTSYLAAQRTQEIGVRMALGADRANILRLIAREGLRLIALGGVAGTVVALCLTQILKSLLFNIGPRDPATFLAMALLLALVALGATLIPARKAMRVDPVEALRCE
jgi:putative ABC transport system permease protein